MMISTRKIRVAVSYRRGVGGPHSEMGGYRKNPIAGTEHFRPWVGLGTFASRVYEGTRTETVCAACGEQADPWGHCDCA